MTKLYNPTYKRWEVIPENPQIRNGEEMAVYVAEDPAECDAYIRRCDKQTQYKKILSYIAEHGSIDRRAAFLLGVAELSARICEMKRDGLSIGSQTVKTYDREGKYVEKHKEYFFA